MSAPIDAAVKEALGTVTVLVSDRCMYDWGMFSSRLATCHKQKRNIIYFIDFKHTSPHTPPPIKNLLILFFELSIKLDCLTGTNI